MSNLAYKREMIDPNTFGAPRTGAHAYRIADTAVIDVAATAALAYVLPLHATYAYSLLSWLVVGEVVHWAVGVRTAWLEGVGLL